MKIWTVVSVCLVWSFNLLEITAENELCAEDLPQDGSADPVLSLNCNTSHLTFLLNLENAQHSAVSYTYSVGIFCNGTQTTLYEVLLNREYYNDPEYNDELSHTLSPGTECTLFGCYQEYIHLWNYHFYAMQPALCVIDVDECSVYTHNCSVHAMCTNTVGGYNCSCEEGYDGDGFHCTDLDECLGVNHSCAVNAHCENVPGSYLCVCDAGYTGDGYNCSNVDECTSGISDCDPYSNCTDTEGSYLCICEEMYEGDGFNCTAVGSGELKEVVAVYVVPVALFLCLVATIVIVISITNWRRRQMWMFKADWGPKELDKDYNPVNPELMPSGSVVSIIESLYHEDMQQKSIAGSWTQTGDSHLTQPLSLSRIGINEDQATSKGMVISGEKSEGVAVEATAAKTLCDAGRSAAHILHNSDEDKNLHLSSVFSSIPVVSPPEIKFRTLVTTPNNPCTNAHSCDHDESGFLSDTSSYIYYELSGK